MHIKFPYHKILVPATNGQRAKKSRLIPYINVRIFNEDKYLDVLALIDSGAEYCLFDGEIGEIIGLENIENDDKIDVLGIGQITIPFYLPKRRRKAHGFIHEDIRRLARSGDK